MCGRPMTSSTAPRGTECVPTCISRERSEEHTSELQSRFDLVCRLLLEKKKKNKVTHLIGCSKVGEVLTVFAFAAVKQWANGDAHVSNHPSLTRIRWHGTLYLEQQCCSG